MFRAHFAPLLLSAAAGAALFGSPRAAETLTAGCQPSWLPTFG